MSDYEFGKPDTRMSHMHPGYTKDVICIKILHRASCCLNFMHHGYMVPRHFWTIILIFLWCFIFSFSYFCSVLRQTKVNVSFQVFRTRFFLQWFRVEYQISSMGEEGLSKGSLQGNSSSKYSEYRFTQICKNSTY